MEFKLEKREGIGKTQKMDEAICKKTWLGIVATFCIQAWLCHIRRSGPAIIALGQCNREAGCSLRVEAKSTLGIAYEIVCL